MSKESEKAIEEIIDYLENLGDEDLHPTKIPFRDRLKIIWDFKSQIKSLWVTGYILITWEWDHNFWKTLDIGFYREGNYE